ncbi:signal recognition particle protein [Candidatus Tachikawaea gelatinosa]|nr:signal recognition particle protein [Candidatus Tachikawaea gelatinosa]
MFDNLINRLSKTLSNIKNRGRLTEANIKETLRIVRIALLEADVALPVVHSFISSFKKKIIGKKINQSLTPGQEFIKLFNNQLIKTMGSNNELNLSTKPPAIILVVGLQGVGKTTFVSKLGHFLFKKQKKKILTVSTDIYRPAAIQQLEILSKKALIDFFPSNKNQLPTNIVKKALEKAIIQFYDVLIVDTAGRLSIDEDMMIEIKEISNVLKPIETLFILDAMTGQDAINTAKEFNRIIPFTGIVLNKTDGDARGGSALSVQQITGKPIKFMGTGEYIDEIEIFHPKRIASRILGMGDVVSLIEEIESKFDQNQVKKLAKKIKDGNKFNFNDFLIQIRQIRKMGNINSLIKKIPGVNNLFSSMQEDNRQIIKMEAIINSMTLKERKKPEIIKRSNKCRIAAGSGLKIQDVNQLIKQFEIIQKMIKKGGFQKIIKNFNFMSKLKR